MPRVLAVIAALGFGAVFLAYPAPGDARQPPTTTADTAAGTSVMSSRAPSTSATYLDGIDVSYHQGAIDWPRVAAAGKRFAYIRASAGSLTADTAYRTNRAGARAAGFVVGTYHFANPDSAPNDAANEAAWFLRNATIESGDLLPVLDLEVSNGLTPGALFAWAQTWLADVERATRVKPLIYTTPTFWARSMANTDWFARNGYRLWVAHWTAAAQPVVPVGNWADGGWSFWQTSSTGVVPGIDGAVDLDRFAGASLTRDVLVP